MKEREKIRKLRHTVAQLKRQLQVMPQTDGDDATDATATATATKPEENNKGDATAGDGDNGDADDAQTDNEVLLCVNVHVRAVQCDACLHTHFKVARRENMQKPMARTAAQAKLRS